MKKRNIAVMAVLASIGSVPVWAMRVQDSVTIQNQAEYLAYTNANTQSDPAVKAAEFEKFLVAYPQSIARKTILEQLVDLYRPKDGDKSYPAAEADKELSASNRLLQVEPQNLKALFYSVQIFRSRGMSGDPKLLDQAADLARKGLDAAKPADISAADWKSLTESALPAFHSAIAVDDQFSKNDGKAAIDEYTAAVNAYPAGDAASVAAIRDSRYLAQMYNTGETKDPVRAIWLFTRAWQLAPAEYKPQIEQQLEAVYKIYHGSLDGLDDVKKQTTASLEPPASFTVKPAPTLADQIRGMLANNPKPEDFSIPDVETILGAGDKDNADKLWQLFHNQTTPVPGRVILATASTVKVALTVENKATKQSKTTALLISLKQPLSCNEAAPPSSDLKQVEDFLVANSASEDQEKLAALFKDTSRIRKIVLDPAASEIQLAVTTEAKASRTADFIVRLKTPIACNKVPATGKDFGMQPALELDGTYDSYRAIAPQTSQKTASSNASVQGVQIVLRDGFVQSEKKKPGAHKPAGIARKTADS